MQRTASENAIRELLEREHIVERVAGPSVLGQRRHLVQRVDRDSHIAHCQRPQRRRQKSMANEPPPASFNDERSRTADCDSLAAKTSGQGPNGQ